MNKNIIFIKDPHLLYGFNQPNNRKETFFDEINNKWNYITNYYINNNIDYIIITGDLLDKMKSLQWTFKSFLKIRKFLENIKEKIGKPIYSIRGNHDELDGINSNKNSVFGNLIDLGLIKYFGEENNDNCINIFLNDKTIGIYGFDWELVLHTAVVDIENGKEHFDCVGYDYLIKTNPKIDMWVLGHYHKGYPSLMYNNKYFINSWNLTRLSRDYYVLNDEHTPEFVHVSFNIINDKIVPSIKNIKVPFLPFKEAFKEDTKEISDIMVDEFKFFTKLEEKVESNFDEFLKLQELKENKQISDKVFKIIKENLI